MVKQTVEDVGCVANRGGELYAPLTVSAFRVTLPRDRRSVTAKCLNLSEAQKGEGQAIIDCRTNSLSLAVSPLARAVRDALKA
jgi:hypothetical protein